MDAELVALVVAGGGLIGAVSAWGTMRVQSRSLAQKTDSDKKAAAIAAEGRQLEQISQLVAKVTEAYTALLEKTQGAHDQIVEGLRMEVAGLRERIATIEYQRSGSEASLERLTQTIELLNAALSERDSTIRRIRQRLNETQGIDSSEVISESVAPDRRHTQGEQ